MTSSTTTKTDTKSLIMNTAERMIAEHGLNGVSNRAILAEAGVSSSALHYHFNSREGLIEAVVVRYGHIPTERLREMVQSFDEQGRNPSIAEIVDSVVDAFIYLLRKKGEAGRRFLRFIARLQSDRTYAHREVERKHFPEINDRLETWIRIALPGVPDAERDLRTDLLLDTVLQTLSNADFMTSEWVDNRQDEKLRDIAARLKTFLVGGFSAPATEIHTRGTEGPAPGTKGTPDEALGRGATL